MEMGVISVGELMGQGEAGKDQVAEGLRRVAGMQGVVAIVMVSDTWHWKTWRAQTGRGRGMRRWKS